MTRAEQSAARLIEEGNALEDDARLQDAMQRYEEAIRLAPTLARAHLNRGNVLLAVGNTLGAIEAFTTALKHDPAYAPAHFNMGNAYVRSGRPQEALAAYREALAARPEFADAEVALGLLLDGLGQTEAAVASYRRALALNPQNAEVHASLGDALRSLGQHADAAESYHRALDINPQNFELHHNLGMYLQGLGHTSTAVASYRRALELRPDVAVMHFNLGNALRELGKIDDAVASYRRTLEINPHLPEAYCNLGNALGELGKLDDAVASYQRAIEMKPDFAEAHCSLGAVRQNLGQFKSAVSSYRRALEINPAFPEAHYNLGNGLRALEQFEDAILSFRDALSINPNYVEAYHNLGSSLEQLGRLDEALASYKRALQIQPDNLETHKNLLFALNYSASHSIPTCLEQARRYGHLAATRAGVTRFASWCCQPTPRLLRVGLVSGDLRNHPVGYFLESLLSRADSMRLEIIAYPTFNKSDDITSGIRRRVADWRPLFGQSDEAAARLIRADGVHVLIDLSGHTDKNRLPVFAFRPAPVQCTWLGYFATTGVAEIDYVLGDPYVTPVEEASHFTERLWQLPDSYLCFTPPRFEVEVGALPALSSHQITFGCFNNLAKMNDEVVALWARVLQEVRGSRLLLKTLQLRDVRIRETTQQRFAARGIAPDRLILEGSSPRAELIATYNRVDIALDPFPYPGGTTSVEALWMGVPFITRRGDRFLSHIGETIAHNSGLSDWIAADNKDYLVKAIEFASNLPRLSDLRAGLRQQVLASPMFDATSFAHNFDAALWDMWRHWSTKGEAKA